MKNTVINFSSLHTSGIILLFLLILMKKKTLGTSFFSAHSPTVHSYSHCDCNINQDLSLLNSISDVTGIWCGLIYLRCQVWALAREQQPLAIWTSWDFTSNCPKTACKSKGQGSGYQQQRCKFQDARKAVLCMALHCPNQLESDLILATEESFPKECLHMERRCSNDEGSASLI